MGPVCGLLVGKLRLAGEKGACPVFDTELFGIGFVPGELWFCGVCFDMKHYPIYSIFIYMIFFKLDKLTFLLYQNKRHKIAILLV